MSGAMHRRVTVLHVIEGLGTGGSEQQLTGFLVRSDASRFRHVVCTFAQVGRFAADLADVGIPVHTLGVSDDGELLRSAARLRRVVGAVAPDIIHASLYRPSVVSRVVGWLSRRPVLTTLVNTPYEPEWMLDNPKLRPSRVWVAQTLDRLTAGLGHARFVAVTEAVKVSTVRRVRCPEDRIVVIPRGLVLNGTPGAGDVAARRAALGWDGAYPVLLNVGRLVPQKGQQYAVRAMPAVLERFPAARLAIAGEGPLRPELERLIRELGLGARVNLLGERRDVPALLDAADIFVFPSLVEGAANALVEAMAAARPCVASAIPSIAEITDNGRVARLAPLRAPDDLAAQVIRLAGDPDLARRLGADGRAWVLPRYDIRRSVAALEALYEHIADGTGAAGSPA
jgi:glycosyltransferase involved in cell wall biosynthesis